MARKSPSAVENEVSEKAAPFPNSGLPPVPWDVIGHLRRPSSSSFHKLAAQLVQANQAAAAGDDELYVVLLCIVGILQFLDTDPVIRGAGLTRPLGTLAAALRDVGEGANPRLFFARPKRGRGRPKKTSFEAARGTIAAAVSVLLDWKESRDAAAKFVAERLGEIGLKMPNGTSILRRQVLRWRDEMGGMASELAESRYKEVRAKFEAVPTEVMSDKKLRRQLVKSVLWGTWSMGF
jgi:hypothetical protein